MGILYHETAEKSTFLRRKNQNTNNETTETTRSAFAAQLRKFEAAERAAAANPRSYGKVLDNTARMIALCVLKKLAMTAGHVEIINGLRRDIMRGGGDGVDLQQEAALALLEEVAKAHDRHGETLPEGWTEAKYNVRHLDKRVVIRSDDSAAWTDAETCAATEAFRAVRTAVQQSRGIQLASLVYCYIDDLATDDETGAEEVLFHRAAKYSTAIDEGGTSDMPTYDYIENACDEMRLTPKQREVLDLRLRGYGCKAIATRRGVYLRSVQKALAAIQKKALAIGLNPSSAAYFAIADKETEPDAGETTAKRK